MRLHLLHYSANNVLSATVAEIRLLSLITNQAPLNFARFCYKLSQFSVLEYDLLLGIKSFHDLNLYLTPCNQNYEDWICERVYILQ